MAIGTDDLIHKFGTQDTVTTTGASSADGAFTSAGATWTNDDDAPQAAFVLKATWATATSINGKVVNLYALLENIEGTDDADTPSADNRVVPLGSFVIPQAITSEQQMPLAHGLADLPNTYTSQVYTFYIENKSGQTISANWELFVTPITVGPHA